ncbi:MAG: hypothetical protein AAF938_27855 [Myxococcota bacterium]
MSDDRQDEDFDAEQLAALARPSLAPAEDEDEDDDDDGALDLASLAASMAPPSPTDEAEADEDDGRVSMAAPAPDAEAKQPTETAKGTEPQEEAEEKPRAAVAATPAEAPSGGSGKALIALVALLGVGAVGFAMTRESGAEEPVASASSSAEGAAGTTPDRNPGADEPAEAAEPAETAEPSEAAAQPAEPAEAEQAETAEQPSEVAETSGDRPSAAVTGNARRTRTRAASEMNAASGDAEAQLPVAAESPSMAPTEAPPSEMAASAMGASTMEPAGDDMDDLLNRALGGTPTAGGTRTVPTMDAAPMEDRSNLPETPSRAAVTRALGGLMPRMRQCAGDQEGIATARLRVNNNGQVVSANIGGRPFGGTPQGSCMEGVVRTARFPRFQRTHFDVTYPFSIRQLNR